MAQIVQIPDQNPLKFLAPKTVIEYGFDQVCTQTFKVIGPNPTPISEIYDSLRYLYNSHCTHSYDCCGCRTYSYSVQRKSRREFKVNLTIDRNC